MAATDAVKLLIDDHGDVNPPSGFRKEFADDFPYRSFLQRQGKTLEEALNDFDWKPDSNRWVSEYYAEKPEVEELIRCRKRVAFDVCGWRELNEDFGRGDVSCLRDIRTPLVTSRTPLKAAKEEFDG